MNRRLASLVVMFVLAALCGGEARALSFDLDSIAQWGKFPRFVVNTYRWGDRFFNGYDTTYVAGTGYKFNAKIITESWLDGYRFVTPNNKYILMHSDPSTSVGVYLSYLALSGGYDVNVSKLMGGRGPFEAEVSLRLQLYAFCCRNLLYKKRYRHDYQTFWRQEPPGAS